MQVIDCVVVLPERQLSLHRWGFVVSDEDSLPHAVHSGGRLCNLIKVTSVKMSYHLYCCFKTCVRQRTRKSTAVQRREVHDSGYCTIHRTRSNTTTQALDPPLSPPRSLALSRAKSGPGSEHMAGGRRRRGERRSSPSGRDSAIVTGQVRGRKEKNTVFVYLFCLFVFLGDGGKVRMTPRKSDFSAGWICLLELPGFSKQ